MVFESRWNTNQISSGITFGHKIFNMSFHCISLESIDLMLSNYQNILKVLSAIDWFTIFSFRYCTDCNPKSKWEVYQLLQTLLNYLLDGGCNCTTSLGSHNQLPHNSDKKSLVPFKDISFFLIDFRTKTLLYWLKLSNISPHINAQSQNMNNISLFFFN